MIFLYVGVFLFLLLILSVVYEPRRFLNALLLMVSVLFLVFGFADMSSHNAYIQIVVYLLLFVVTPLIILCMAVLLIINGFVMVRKEGNRLKNFLSFFVGIAVIVGIFVSVALMFIVKINTMLMSVLWLGAILSAYFALTFLALLIYSALYTQLPKQKQCDYIIVHGCGLLDGERVSPLLKDRVDKAVYIFEKTGGQVTLVLSGGQGRDEKISEAQAMKNYLIGRNFPGEKLIIEDKSTTTFENLRNVRDMLDTDGRRRRYLFVTNNYHVFRTGLYAKKLKMNADGVGCKTAAYYWPSAFIREYVAIMVRYKWITIFVVLCWLVITIVSLFRFNGGITI